MLTAAVVVVLVVEPVVGSVLVMESYCSFLRDFVDCQPMIHQMPFLIVRYFPCY